MKVLFVLMHSAPYRDPVINAFLKANKEYDVDVVYLYGDGVLCHPEWNLAHETIEVIPHKKIKLLNKTFDWHKGLLKKVRKYDAIFIGGYFPVVNLLLLIKSVFLHKKIIFNCDTVKFKKGFVHNFIYRYVRKSSAFFVPGLRTKNALIQDLGIQGKRIFCGSYLIDSNTWISQIQKYKKTASSKFKLLFVGKLREIRNIPLLMDVAESLRKKNENIELIYIGDGTCYKNSLVAQIDRGGVVWVPECSYDSLAEYYAQADCYIHPGKEPYSLALSQAAFAGIPIVSHFAVGAADDYIKDGYNGIVVNEDKVDYFVDSVLQIKNNLEVFSDNAKKYAEEIQKTRSVDWGKDQLLGAVKACAE